MVIPDVFSFSWLTMSIMSIVTRLIIKVLLILFFVMLCNVCRPEIKRNGHFTSQFRADIFSIVTGLIAVALTVLLYIHL